MRRYKKWLSDSSSNVTINFDGQKIKPFFDWEFPAPKTRASDALDEPILRDCPNFDSEDSESRRLSFSLNSSYLNPECAVINKGYLSTCGSRAFTTRRNMVIGFMLLVIMLISLSSTGPLILALPSPNVYVQATWRYQG